MGGKILSCFCLYWIYQTHYLSICQGIFSIIAGGLCKRNARKKTKRSSAICLISVIIAQFAQILFNLVSILDAFGKQLIYMFIF